MLEQLKSSLLGVAKLAGRVQEKLEKVPPVKVFGEFLRSEAQKNQQAFQDLESNFRKVNIKLAERFKGREFTQEEKDKVLYIDPLGFVGGMQKVTQVPKQIGLIEGSIDFFRSLGRRVERAGKYGEYLGRTIKRAFDVGEVNAGKRTQAIIESGLGKLDDAERINLFDVLEGRANPANKRINDVFKAIRAQTDDVAKEAVEKGVKVRRRTVLEPTPRVPEIPKELQLLTEEARKYKSAEEFVNSRKFRLDFEVEQPVKKATEVIPDTSSSGFHEGFAKDFNGIEPSWGVVVDRKLNNLEIKAAEDAGLKVSYRKDLPKTTLAGKNQHDLTDIYLPNVKQTETSKAQKVFNQFAENYKSQLTDFYNRVTKGVKVPTGLTPFQREQLEMGRRVVATIEKPFAPRENFYPHVIPNAEALRKGSAREDVLNNLVRLGIKKSPQEATSFLDDYIGFIETGAKKQSLLDYMVATGQSKNEAEALANLQRFRRRTIKRQGSLEFAREVDLPFYDPDPLRVIPSYVAGSSMRLAQIGEFGQDQRIINNLINKIRKAGGDEKANTIRYGVDRILGVINDGQTGVAKTSRLLRTLQGFKLGLAAIPNVTQGALNSLLAGDLRAAAYGVGRLFTKAGKQFALRSGATLDSVINEMSREAGASGKILRTFLKSTGFTGTEKMNRIIAANAGLSYGRRLFSSLLKNPNHRLGRQMLSELGVDVDKALARGSLAEDELLVMGKKFSDMTQFRARPQDLPLFASSPQGKVFFQFKNFIYNQTRLVYRTTIQELRNKNFGRATRNFLILATIFPVVGNVIRQVRNIVTGREEESEGFKKYFESIASVGALGIFGDAISSARYGRATEFLVGPTVGEFGEMIEILASGKLERLEKFGLRRIPFIGQILSQRVFPSKSKKKKLAPSVVW